MVENKNNSSNKTDSAQGTQTYTGSSNDDVEITIIDYDSENQSERKVENIEESFSFKDSSSVTWINVVGLQRVDVIEKIGKYFGIHYIVLKDILTVGQRPKVEDFDEYLFVVLKMINTTQDSYTLKSEQISIIFGKNFVFTFQEKKGDVFDPIRDCIKNEKCKTRKMGADYLTYTIIDTIVDNYFVALEKLGEKIETIEDMVVYKPTPNAVHLIHRMKRSLSLLRRSVWPLREVVAFIEKTESKLIKKESQVYFRDVYEHTIQTIENVENYRDTLSGLLDIYLSSLSNKMNEIMKVLTIIATIFIPLTFITGVYGMNFKYMPELEWRIGYPIIMLLMIIIALGMVIYFKKKKWF